MRGGRIVRPWDSLGETVGGTALHIVLQCQASVHDDRLAGNVTRRGRGQEYGHPLELIQLAQAAQRGPVREALSVSADRRGGHPGPEPARCTGADPEIVAGPPPGSRAGASGEPWPAGL